MKLTPEHLVVSCEHASNAIPSELRGLGLSRGVMSQHVAWDPGAADIAREVARRFEAPLHLGKWSRLVVDLNRRVDHRKLCAAETFGVRVPGNAALSRSEIGARVERWWKPYRAAVEADIAEKLHGRGACLHFSSHSFTPRVKGVERDVDIGLLYDPAHALEKDFADALARALAHVAPTLRLRRNQPYRGTADGFVRCCRSRHPRNRYCGFELEVNQRLLGSSAARMSMARLVANAVELAL